MEKSIGNCKKRRRRPDGQRLYDARNGWNRALCNNETGHQHQPYTGIDAYGKSSVEDQVRCFNAGANGYLTKPFDMKMLNARIDNLMKSNQKRQEKFRVDTEINVVALEYQSTDEQFLEKAIECIEQHLIETEFDIDTFASELNVSKSTLNRKMKAMIGLSPVEFTRNIRLKHACTLLKSLSLMSPRLPMRLVSAIQSISRSVLKRNLA